MSPITTSSNALSVEDFRRLGVRPNEYRLSVIRSAASRSAGPLADRYLATPTDEQWVQLSRVATSAYRLMDPRLRLNATQRAYVGRILPMTLSAAGKTRFHSAESRSLDRQQSTASLESDFGQDDRTSTAFGLESKGPILERSSDEKIWQVSLDDDDLVRGSRFKRPWATRPRLRLWGGMVSGGVLILAGLGWSSLMARPGSGPLADLPPDSVASLSPTTQTSALDAVVTEETDAVRSDTVDSDAMVAGEPAPTPVAVPPSIDPPTFDLKAMILASTLPEPRVSITKDMPPQNPSVVAPSLAPPTEPEPLPAIKKKEPVSPAAPVPTPTKEPRNQEPDKLDILVHPVPLAEDALAAHGRLWKLVNPLGQSITRDNLKSIRDAITLQAEASSLGSSDHYAAIFGLATLVWLDEPPEQSLGVVFALFSPYSVDQSQPGTQSFLDASRHVTLPKDHDRLIASGLRLMEELITAGSLDQCDQVIATLRPSVKLSTGQDWGSWLDRYEKSMKKAHRLASSTERLIQTEGPIDLIDADISGGGALGRYHCLVLRQWNEGLRFLAKTSDPRLSSLASAELVLHADDPFFADPQPWALMADRWWKAAERMSNRSADSLRQHAIDLLQQASKHAQGVALLEIERSIEEWDASMPSLPTEVLISH